MVAVEPIHQLPSILARRLIYCHVVGLSAVKCTRRAVCIVARSGGSFMVRTALRIVAPEGRRDEFARAFTSIIGPTRVQPGCLGCWLYQGVADENSLTYVEEWASEAALDRRIRSPEYGTILGLLDASAEPPEFTVDACSRRLGLEYVTAIRGTGAR